MPSDEPRLPLALPGARLRPSRSARWLYGLLGVLGLVVAGTSVWLPELRAALGVCAAVIAAPLAIGLLQLHRNRSRGGGRVEVHADGVHVEGRLALPRPTLARAVVAPAPGGVTVSLERQSRGFVAVLDVASVEQGQALVRALGLSATQTLSTFRFDSPIAAALRGWKAYVGAGLILPLLIVPMYLGLAWLALPLALGWYAALIGAMLPTLLTIGLDGISVGWLWRRALIRFEDLAGIEHDGERLRLTHAAGRRFALAVQWTGTAFDQKGSGDVAFASRQSYLDAVVARIEEAHDASDGERARAPAAALLRRGRSVAAWARDLRALLARGAQGFRDPETAPEQLWEAVEDGAAEPAVRAAAAIALGPALAEPERERLRRVARVVVAPKLRIAIEAVARDDDAAVEEALAALAPPREGRRVR